MPREEHGWFGVEGGLLGWIAQLSSRCVQPMGQCGPQHWGVQPANLMGSENLVAGEEWHCFPANTFLDLRAGVGCSGPGPCP